MRGLTKERVVLSCLFLITLAQLGRAEEWPMERDDRGFLESMAPVADYDGVDGGKEEVNKIITSSGRPFIGLVAGETDYKTRDVFIEFVRGMYDPKKYEGYVYISSSAPEIKSARIGSKFQDEPQVFYVDPVRQKQYLSDRKTKTKEAMEAFIVEVESNKRAEHKRSQKVPPNNFGPVFTVVRDTMKEMIFETAKEGVDVMVMLTGPPGICEICHQREKHFKGLAIDFMGQDDFGIKFVTLDVILNDITDKRFKSRIPPHYMMVKAGVKPIVLDMIINREPKIGEIVEFIEENRTSKPPKDILDDDDDEDDEEL